MGDKYAPCPFCRLEIPEFSEICGHCHSEVGWHGGWAYPPEIADRKWGYTELIWRGWPWKSHLAVGAGLFIVGLVNDPDIVPKDMPSAIGSLMAVVFVLGAIGLPIYAFRWLYVRAKYSVD